LNLRHVGEFVDALPMTTTRRILRHELGNAELAKLADLEKCGMVGIK
jgi:hypothetical protein